MPGLTVQYGWHICNQNIVPQISCVEGVSDEDFCPMLDSAWYLHICGLEWPFNPLFSLIWAAGWKPSKMTPWNFRPPNPEIIMVKPQWKFHGLENVLYVGLIPCQVLLSSECLWQSYRPIDVANLMGKCIRMYYLSVCNQKSAKSTNLWPLFQWRLLASQLVIKMWDFEPPANFPKQRWLLVGACSLWFKNVSV
jgi:hypothetical protein